MMRKGVERDIIVGVLLIALMSQCVFAVLNIETIKMDPESVTWFDVSDSQFQLNNLGGINILEIQAGDIRTFGAADFDYAFEGTLSITPCSMMGDYSGSGWAAAQFAGSSVMTVTATKIWEADNPTNELLNNPSGVVFLSALMSADPWYVLETGTSTDFFAGDNSYAVQGGELLGGSIMRMGDFQGYFSFPETGPGNIAAFNQDLVSNQPAITLVDPNPAPEPASLVLLTLGVLALRKK